jgi:OFA family oxalate/formate antiporter-like MFS transporter
MTRSHSRPEPAAPGLKGRWVFIALGLVSLLCMGTVYSWSIFRAPLQAHFDIASTRSLLPFTVLLVTYALLMPVAGRKLDTLGPRKLMGLGGLLVGGGYFLAGFAPGPGWLTLFYGGMAGAGVGIAYGVPLAVSARWYPDRKGLALGLTVIGFGLSPLLTAPLAKMLIQRYGVMAAFRILGAGFALLIPVIASRMRFPEPGRMESAFPGLFSPPDSPRPALPPFWKLRGFAPLWFCYMLGTYVGLTAIGISSSVASEVIGIDSAASAGLVSLFAVFNGLGRPLFGTLTDRLSPARAALISYALICAASVLMLGAGQGSRLLYIVSFCVFWLCLGGWLALAPTATAKLFPVEGYPKYYGYLFTAYGAGALLGTLTAGSLRDIFGSYRFAFLPFAAIALLGMGVVLIFFKSLNPGKSVP